MTLKFKDLLNGVHKPNLHGNGFIQLDVAPNWRLHVWPMEPIPAQKVYTPWHDHVFRIESTILVGFLKHTHFRIAEVVRGTHHLYEAHSRTGSNTELIKKGTTFNIEEIGTCVFNAGSNYSFEPHEFHTSEGIGLTATLMHKVRYPKKSIDVKKPRVLCTVDKMPDNEYNRDTVDMHLLWKEINTIFQTINHITIPE